MPTIVTDACSFTADRAWGTRDLAEVDGATVRLHWTDRPYRWHVNDGNEVFVVLDGRLVTPPLGPGCLAGISRALLLEAMAAAGTPAHEAAVPMDRLPEVTEAFLVSTARHVQPVRGLLGATRSDLGLASAPGEHTRRAAQVWREAYGSVLDP